MTNRSELNGKRDAAIGQLREEQEKHFEHLLAEARYTLPIDIETSTYQSFEIEIFANDLRAAGYTAYVGNGIIRVQ